MAAALLAHRLAQTGVPAVVRSAGTHATGLAVSPHGVAALAERGVTLTGHVPRRLDVPMVAADGADLVLAMTREHRRAVVLLDPSAWPRAFTLRELVRLGRSHGGRGDDETLAGWLARLSATRLRADLFRDDPSDDIADPYGGTVGDYRDTARELEGLTAELVMLAHI